MSSLARCGGLRGSRPAGALGHCVFGVASVLLAAACGEGERPLEWVQEDGHRWAALSVSGERSPGFEQVDPARSGIDFVNVVTEDQLTENSHYLNGSGVAIGDADGDGRADVYFASMDGPNRLYLNLGGWRFEEVAAASGVAAEGRFSTGAVFADADGDSDLDLFVTALGGPNSLFLNDGSGRFTEAGPAAGLQSTRGSMSMALADVEGDGDLDLYVANNKLATLQDLYPPDELLPSRLYVRGPDGEIVLAPEFEDHYSIVVSGDGGVARSELAEPDAFYLNDGTAHFEPVSFSGGAFLDESGQPLATTPLDWALSVRFQDFDGDRDPDIYVANDFQSPDHFWINDGDGGFRAVSKEAIRATSFASMAADFADVDRDGDQDFFVAEMLSRDHRRRMRQMGGGGPDREPSNAAEARPQKPRNTLYLYRGDGTWAETALYSGVAASEWSWGSLFMDVDLDGWEDLLVANGHFYDAMDRDAAARSAAVDWRRRILAIPQLRTRNVAFRNAGGVFEHAPEWGFGPDEDISHGMALGDLDGDGDLDVVVNRLGDPALVLRNVARAPRVAVRLRGRGGNTAGIGAAVSVVAAPSPGGRPFVQSKEIVAGGGYLSGSEQLWSFAAGEPLVRAGAELAIEVAWRSGALSRIEGVRPNRIYEVFEPAPATETAASGSPGPFFEDVSHLLGHVHSPPDVDDFALQPLLPHRVSTTDPAVAWSDLDTDGWPDLCIADRDGSVTWFRNDGAGGFDLVPGGPGEAGPPSWEGAPPVTVAADLDGDGSLEVFRGGRAVPGRYPNAQRSRIYRLPPGSGASALCSRAGGGDVLAVAFAGDALADAGLVSGAVFSDLDGDGDPDLVLAVEWGPVRVFLNEFDEGGELMEATDQLGLSDHTGWWNGVATGDLNSDGRPDIVAANRGLNTPYRATAEHPAMLFHGDVDNNGTWDVIEARYDDSTANYVPVRGLLTMADGLPILRSRIQGYTQYAEMELEGVLGRPLETLDRDSATQLGHMVFLSNADGGYDAALLPPEAQLAPAFQVVIADLDGDGHQDVFLPQNMSSMRSALDSENSGRSLWLRGDGRGDLQPVPGQESGLIAYGDQRGAAVADYDRDGRLDLVIAQHGGETKLFRNVRARPTPPP
ncbi:MAG: VCBS repeat-containing protein [Gemmatimonadetes bacterium]|nr:VCBS repeat-containing protein [Gemmatimonadota bacterium]